MRTRLLLVRHGQSVWNKEKRYAGSSDIALNDTGRVQAQRLGLWARSAGLAAIWSSPLIRAQATAQPASEATGVAVHEDERLAELGFGPCEGLTEAEILRKFPAAQIDFSRDSAACALPGGEDLSHAAERVVAALEDLARSFAGERLLVVSHSALIRLALCRLLGIPLARFRSVFPAIENCALSEVALDDSFSHPAALLSLNVPLSLGKEAQF